jgi:RimJ/RimL family protein N-acetyltransferase
MILLTPDQTRSLKGWFLPERPGPLIGLHVILTGNGTCFTDRWPDPRAVLVDTAGNTSLSGVASAVTPADLQSRIRGFVETSPELVPVLEAAFPELKAWERVVFVRPSASRSTTRSGFQDGPKPQIRPLKPANAEDLQGLSPEITWISKTWGGPQGLAASGCAWGAFIDRQLASVACTFFYGEKYEDIGVVTEPEFRGLGLSTACAAALCDDIQARGRQPSWTTSPDNTASLRVAEKLGFVFQREDRLYVVGISIPNPKDQPYVRSYKSGE